MKWLVTDEIFRPEDETSYMSKIFLDLENITQQRYSTTSPDEFILSIEVTKLLIIWQEFQFQQFLSL